jgi:hypothetical protein
VQGRLALDGAPLRAQQADGRKRDGTARMEKAAVADFHEAVRQDVLEEPADKFHDLQGRGAEADTAHFPGGEGARAVLQADQTMVGDGDLEDLGGQGGAGGMAVVVGLTVDVPRGGPDLRVDLLQQPGLVHGVFEEGAVDRGERFDRDKEVGAGGQPGRAVLGEAPTGHNVMDVRMGLELPAPGVPDPGKAWEISPNETCIGGEPFEGC